MTRMVMCRKYQQEMEGLAFPPFNGAKGQTIFETVSKQAWQEWLKHQTMLINE
ncbi:MAG TPA: oxidative damage protection protein, partial [Agitococcus sp.]|nr:oxidative damage protection protein [Agitococcus sp.]